MYLFYAVVGSYPFCSGSRYWYAATSYKFEMAETTDNESFLFPT